MTYLVLGGVVLVHQFLVVPGQTVEDGTFLRRRQLPLVDERSEGLQLQRTDGKRGLGTGIQRDPEVQ